MKTRLYLGFFMVFIIFIGWLISYLSGTYFFLWFAVIYSTLASFISYWYSDKIVLAMSRARLIKKEDNPELYRIVENLCITAGLPLPKIYILEEPQPNAFATGRNPQHAVVAVTRGLLERLEKTELEGVIAHELAHIGNRDALLQTIVVVLVGVLVTMSNMFFRMRLRGGGKRGNAGAIFVVIGLALIILVPLIATLIRLAISRKREFLADASGALLTRYPQGLAQALEKISKDSSPLSVAQNSTAHLYIVNPFKGEGGKTSWLVRVFMTHPPIEDRVKILREMEI